MTREFEIEIEISYPDNDNCHDNSGLQPDYNGGNRNEYKASRPDYNRGNTNDFNAGNRYEYRGCCTDSNGGNGNNGGNRHERRRSHSDSNGGNLNEFNGGNRREYIGSRPDYNDGSRNVFDGGSRRDYIASRPDYNGGHREFNSGNRREYIGSRPNYNGGGNRQEYYGLNGGADNNRSWRANYGVSPNIGRHLEQQNDRIQNDAQNIRPQGQWQPNPSKLRDWKDRFDDPYMNRTLDDLYQNGIPRVFRPQQQQYYDRFRR